MASQQCITPNADISGIGVRVAVYVQSFLYVIQACMALLDGKVDREEEQQLTSSWTNSMLFTIGIILSAFIQAGLGDLSVHHGLVTLNLCWLIIISELPSMIVLTLGSLELTETMLPRRQWWRDNTKSIYSIHALRGILWFTLGLVVWASVDPADSCTRLTDYVILFKYAISPASRGLRFTSMALYASPLAMCLIILFIAICGIMYKVISNSNSLDSDSASQGTAFANPCAFMLPDPRLTGDSKMTFIICFTLYQVYFIACTEVMVKKNARLFIGGESQENVWTFGQTLALLMLSPPLLEFVKSFSGEMKRRGQKKTRGTNPAQPGTPEVGAQADQATEDQEVDPSRVGDIESGDRELRE